jgi:betaine-aldehyde dehydrogenase
MSLRANAEKLASTVPSVPYVAGTWQTAEAAGTFEVIDPVTERAVATITEADAATVDLAVSSGHSALDDGEWGRLDGASRGVLLGRLADLLDSRREDFANLESLEIGKPGIEPRVIDLPQAVQTFRHYAGWADKIEGRTIPTPGYMGRRTLSYTVREPIGVVAAITPWNSPTMIGAWKIAPALAA